MVVSVRYVPVDCGALHRLTPPEHTCSSDFDVYEKGNKQPAKNNMILTIRSFSRKDTKLSP